MLFALLPPPKATTPRHQQAPPCVARRLSARVRCHTGRLFHRATLLLALAGVAAAGAETIRLRADPWMPFNGDPTDPMPGYVVELARKIFEPHGITVDYRNLAWGDALKAAAAGEIEGVIGANRSEAADLVVPQEPIGTPRVGLFVRKGQSWRYTNITSLAQIRLGVILDYKYWETLDGYVQKHGAPQIVTLAGDHPIKDALAKLDAGEIDVFPETLPVFAWNLKEAGRSGGEFPAVYLHEGEDVFVAFTPKQDRGARYAQLFDEGLRALRKSGELAAILARYGQKDWQK